MRTGQNFILAWLKVVFSVLFCNVNVDDVLLSCFVVGYAHGWLRHAGCVQWHEIEELHFCRSYF